MKCLNNKSYEYSQINEHRNTCGKRNVHAIVCITCSWTCCISKMHSVRCFVFPVGFWKLPKPKQNGKWQRMCMVHETLLHFISIHTWANRRYSVAESQTSHWINQADLHIPSMNIYSFLFAILLVWPMLSVQVVWMRLKSTERIAQCSFCVELNFWWNSLA